MLREVIIDVGPPCPLPLARDDTVVVVDVIRSMTTAVTAVAQGRRCVPVPSVPRAWAAARQTPDALLVGEVGGVRPDGFDMTNSPAEIALRADVERPIVLLSSSGTPLLDAVQEAGAIWLACFRNWRAIAERVSASTGRVLVLGAGSRGEFREEDQMCCAWIAGALAEEGFVVGESTAELIARWAGAAKDAFLGSRSVGYLRKTGQLQDLEFILDHFDDLRVAHALRRGEVAEVV